MHLKTLFWGRVHRVVRLPEDDMILKKEKKMPALRQRVDLIYFPSFTAYCRYTRINTCSQFKSLSLMAAPPAYGSYQARDCIQATAVATRCAGLGIEPEPLPWPETLQLDSKSTAPQQELEILRYFLLWLLFSIFQHGSSKLYCGSSYCGTVGSESVAAWVAAKAWVHQSPDWCSGLKIQHCCSCGTSQFNPWLGNFHILWVQSKQKTKQNKTNKNKTKPNPNPQTQKL